MKVFTTVQKTLVFYHKQNVAANNSQSLQTTTVTKICPIPMKSKPKIINNYWYTYTVYPDEVTLKSALSNCTKIIALYLHTTSA